jgi:hypothetical protein
MMKGPIREERLAAGVSGVIAGCPPAEQLQDFHDGSLAPEAHGEMATHLSGCGRCAAAIERLRLEATEDHPAALPPDVEKRTADLIDAVRREAAAPSRSRWSGALRIAAMLAFAVALGLGAWQWLGPDGLDDDLGTYRGGEPLDLLEPIGAVTAPPVAMRWEAHPEAASYRVVLLDEELAMIWTRRNESAEGRIELDAEALQVFEPGSRYSWQVEALDAVGAVIDSSSTAHFEIAGAAQR